MMEIDVHTAKLWKDSGHDEAERPVSWIDCREPEEYALARIEGAQLWPLSQWPPSEEELRLLEGRRAIVYCHHGVRSLRVASWLRQSGFQDAVSMRGGIDAWSSEIDPEVPQY
jgi:rhodanese-related sulfurtransferase